MGAPLWGLLRTPGTEEKGDIAKEKGVDRLEQARAAQWARTVQAIALSAFLRLAAAGILKCGLGKIVGGCRGRRMQKKPMYFGCYGIWAWE